MHPSRAVTAVAPFSLAFARYRFDCVAQTPIRLPDHAGSLLRGAFGHALRQVACITREKDCAPCALKAACPYSAVFAPGKPAQPHRLLQNSEIPVPYVIEPPPWGARVIESGAGFSFHMLLIGRALEHLPIVVLAWRRALLRGLGAGDGRAELAALRGEDGDTLYSPEAGRIAAHDTPPRAIPPVPVSRAIPATLTLHFHSPLRLQHNGSALAPHRLSPRPLILAAARRASLLGEFHGSGAAPIDWKALAGEADALSDRRQLEWRDWTRYSSRQHQAMTLGGVVGDWTLQGEFGLAWPWLHLGQWLHVGKETAFGLGGYRIESGESKHNSAPDRKDCERPAQGIEGKEEKV